MTGKTHMLGGLLAGAVIITVIDKVSPEASLSIAESGMFMASSTITALLPDVDEINSKAGRRLFIIPLTLGVIKTILFLIEIFTFGWLRKKIKETRRALNHRGVFHWLLTWGILSGVVFFLCLIIYVLVNNMDHTTALLPLLCFFTGFIPGYLSHIALDLISGRIQLFAPFNKKWYGKQLIKVGSLVEVLLVRPVLVIAIVFALYLLIK